MTEDLNLFVDIAHIGGVFVAFGALISVTRGSSVDHRPLGHIQTVVTIGLVVIVASLIPIGLSRYGVDERTLWTVASLAFLILIWVSILSALRRPENRRLLVTSARSSPIASSFFWFLLEIPMQVPLFLAVLGIAPELGSAFYTTALVLNLFEAAFVLTQFVYSHVATLQS